jgi:hypothetical protein
MPVLGALNEAAPRQLSSRREAPDDLISLGSLT